MAIIKLNKVIDDELFIEIICNTDNFLLYTKGIDGYTHIYLKEPFYKIRVKETVLEINKKLGKT